LDFSVLLELQVERSIPVLLDPWRLILGLGANNSAFLAPEVTYALPELKAWRRIQRFPPIIIIALL
jgi:hypothetical protein